MWGIRRGGRSKGRRIDFEGLIGGLGAVSWERRREDRR